MSTIGKLQSLGCCGVSFKSWNGLVKIGYVWKGNLSTTYIPAFPGKKISNLCSDECKANTNSV